MPILRGVSSVVKGFSGLTRRFIGFSVQQYIALLCAMLMLSPLPSGVASPGGQQNRARFAAAIGARRSVAGSNLPFFQSSPPIAVSVAYADNSSPTAAFPIPWQGAPNVAFIGAGSPTNAGAIRIDNPTSAPLFVNSVSVDMQRPGPVFNLWGSFTIPAQGSAILTQTEPGNFDTSAFPLTTTCGGTLAPGETRIPKITVTIAGVAQTFNDTAHVLDTGGFLLSCRGNESLAWRQIGTTGISNPNAKLTLTGSASSANGGTPVTMTAQLTDASNLALANATVSFRILTGPNAGQTGTDFTDSQGNAHFTYTSSAQGGDVIQAFAANTTDASIASNQVTVSWQAAACAPTSPVAGAQTGLTYLGPDSVDFNDPLPLAALLTDVNGSPLSGKTLSFTLGAQTLTAVTDSTGVARVTATGGSPGSANLSISFAGDGTNPLAQASRLITFNPEESQIRYTGKTLLGTAAPQQVSAILLDPAEQTPIAGRTLKFQIGSVSASAVTDMNGNATASLTLTPNEASGPAYLKISFAGDPFYKPALRTVPVTIYLSTSFVVWGANTGGLKLGQDVNFWGSQWPEQVIQGDPVLPNDFKGFADPIGPIQICQPHATVSTITTGCWSSKPGQSFPPPLTLPAYIEVIVSTMVVKHNGLIYGNIAGAAVVKVDATPAYGPAPGQQGFGVLVATILDTGVFPPPAAITATQAQPAAILPTQSFTISTTVTNTSAATGATAVALSETFDGMQPASGAFNFGNISPNTSQNTLFQVSTPAIPIRQVSESSSDYLTRLGGVNGRLFTAGGQVSFSDSLGQPYLPVDVSSSSVLQIPILSLSLTGPASVSPGATVPYTIAVTNVGGAVANTAAVNVTLPDGSTRAVSFNGIAPGASSATTIVFANPPVGPIGQNETTDAYLARLAAADGKLLTASADLNWTDTAGNPYGDVGAQMFTATVRVPILNLTPTVPATLLPSQNATLSFDVRNTGGCTALLSDLKVTNPDGTVTAAPQFPLAAGQSTTIQTNWRVTGISTRLQGDTDAVYLARLVAANNSNLNFSVGLDWSDPGSATYGPVSFPATSREILPIVTVALSAPATATSGTSIAYTVTATNIGAAPSPQVVLTLTLPDGSIQTPTVGSLAPNGSFQTTINYAIPSTQPAGNITATASVIWNDAIANAYGPLNAATTTAVTNPQQFNSLVLTPAAAGQNVVGSPQTFTATLKDSNGVAISGATVQFTVTGANPRTSSGVTNASGIVALTYTGAAAGLDTVQATSGTAVSNNGVVNWIVPVSAISTSPLLGRFFASPDGNGVFNIPSTATPLWTQAFPTIDFNPPPNTIPGNTSGVNDGIPPFADVITDLTGNFTGTIVAQGNGYIAGVGLPSGVTIPGVSPLRSFEAVFTGSLTVRSAGQMVFNFFSDDGFVLGIGGGATRVSGAFNNPPSSGFTAFENFPVMGANNTPHAPGGDQIVVNFPSAGTYPYEVDYTENTFGELSLTMTTASTNGHGVPPTGSVTLTPNAPPAQPAGQAQTLVATVADGSGTPLPNLGVALIINGANQQQLSSTTNAQGQATFTYTGTNAGQDSAQAVTNIAGMGTFSALVNITWTVPTGGGGGGGVSQFITPGWIGSPLPYTLVQGQQAIRLGDLTLTSGIVDFWPSSNPSLVTVLNANASGGSGATLATFDATTVADGEYVVRLRGTLSNGTTQTSLIPLKVTGDNKPGRFTATVTDLTVPLAGIPITIGRTYDSLERGNVEDFGNGWKLSVGGTQLAVSGSHDVSFTIGGRRMTFFFRPQSEGFPFPFLLTTQYAPEPGVFGTLTSDGCAIVVVAGSTTECFPDVFDTY